MAHDDRNLRLMLERYADDRDECKAVEKPAILETIGSRSDVDTIHFSPDSKTIVVVTVPEVVNVVKNRNGVILSTAKQMRALVHIKERFGFEGYIGILNQSRDKPAILNMARNRGIPYLSPDELARRRRAEEGN